VILSQIFSGLAQGLDGEVFLNGKAFANALAMSSRKAYEGVSHPVEGTILTVIREAAIAAQNTDSSDSDNLLVVMETVVKEARDSVARTPTLLPVLHEAGVVDAGGEGLYLILEGALSRLRGESEENPATPLLSNRKPPPETQKFASLNYGYCTEFIIQGDNLSSNVVKEKLCVLGESVLVVGNDAMLRVHIHTLDPGTVLSYATSLGTLHQIKIDNLDEQHRDFIASQQRSLSKGEAGVVAVVSGEGLGQVFLSLKATAIVSGGQTMNPSVEELLRAVNSMPTDKVIILPNNRNILSAAEQVKSLTEKIVEVVPSKTIPQGVEALLTFNNEATFEENVAAMREALTAVRSGGITTAVRSMKFGSLSVKEGQFIGFLENELVAVGDDVSQVIQELFAKMSVEKGELITIYYGADTAESEVEEVVNLIQQKYPFQEIEVVFGGQPYYNYIISVE
jgi:hypothetical protein